MTGGGDGADPERTRLSARQPRTEPMAPRPPAPRPDLPDRTELSHRGGRERLDRPALPPAVRHDGDHGDAPPDAYAPRPLPPVADEAADRPGGTPSPPAGGAVPDAALIAARRRRSRVRALVALVAVAAGVVVVAAGLLAVLLVAS